MVRRALVLGLCFALFTLQPSLGGAAVITYSFSHTGVSISDTSVEFYDYTQASTATWSSQVDFDTGTYTGANGIDVAGSVVLDRIGPTDVVAPSPAPWWDTAWNNRRCYDLDHTAAAAQDVAEYQIRLPFPLDAMIADGWLQADQGDLRAIAADGATSLPLWADDTEPNIVWVQVDSIPAATDSTICIYYGFNAGTATSPTNHTEAAVFSYTTPRPIYYAVSEDYGTLGTEIAVVSYIDGNEVTRSDGTTVSLPLAGDRTTFEASGTTAGSTFSVLGPISASGSGDRFDSLVPISFAGTRFVAPISRDAQRFSIYAPFGDAAVGISDGASSADTFTVAADTSFTHLTTDISAGNSAIIESDVPILVSHISDLGGDSVALYPATAGEWFGVRSGSVLIGYGTDGSGTVVNYSDGASVTDVGDRGDASTLPGGSGQGGAAGDGVSLTADLPIGVAIHEDGDGNESAIGLPRRELSSQYWIPDDVQYTSFACPTGPTPIELTVTPPTGPTAILTCEGGPAVAWALDSTVRSVDPLRGISVAADAGQPFFAYYESVADDQTSLLGIKQGRQLTWPEPVVTPGGDEGLYETTGSWESATFDTGAGTGIFGLIDIGGIEPPETAIRVQVATAASGTPTEFVGPDGTSTSYFTIAALPAVLDFAHDHDRLLRLRADLSTSDPVAATPRLDVVAVDHHLGSLDRSLAGSPLLGITTTLAPLVTSTYLLRVKTNNPGTAGSESTAVYRGDSNLANLTEETVRFVNASLGIDSVQQSTTTSRDPAVPFDPGRPHSVVIDHSAAGTGVTRIAFAWQLDYLARGSVFFETDFLVELTAP